VFPKLLEGRDSDSPIRLWVPGCSSGEEVYSTVITLLECLDGNSNRLPMKIFATDIDESAVNTARLGKYLENIASDVSPERLRRFFSRVEGGYQINKSIRDLCVFARQDVTRDPPFSNIDMVSCRNVLIYLGQALQKRVLPIFHYALKENGILLLGNSETIGAFQEQFRTVDAKHKIYARKESVKRPGLFFDTPEPYLSQSFPAEHVGEHELTALEIQKEADRLVMSKYAPAGVVVNEHFEILQFRGQTGAYLEPAPGTAALNLLRMAREGLLPSLRTLMEQAKQGRKAVQKEHVRVKSNGDYREITLVISPFALSSSKARLFIILFEDPQLRPAPAPPLTAPDKVLHDALGEAGHDARHLEEELSSTRGYLTSIIEEREATNEELKAANEEIVSSNEELRSTNEELQTAKEELQATNEELGTVNDELRHRNEEANRLNDDLSALLSSVQIPIIMLGQGLQIRRFTPSAAQLLNLIPTDAGRPLGDIKPRLFIPDFEQLVARVIDSLATDERDVQDVDGRWHRLAIRPYKTSSHRIEGAVITVMDIDPLKRSEQRYRAAELRLRLILDTAAEGIIIIGENGNVQEFNQAAEKIFGYPAAEMIGKDANGLLSGDQGDLGQLAVGTRELRGRRKGGPTFPLNVHVSEVEEGKKLYTAIVRDITKSKEEQQRVVQAERLASIGQVSAGLAHESRNALQRAQACLEMLRREIKDQPAALSLVSRIQEAQDRLLQLYEETRTYAAPINLDRQQADLNAVLQNAWDSLEDVHKARKAKLRSKPGKLNVHCELDAGQIEQVMRNILENSLQACSDPANIHVRWSDSDLAGKPAVQIAIRNNGPVLTQQEMQHLFEAFFTTKTRGTGLGLTIARRIVEAHGGAIDFNAKVEDGAEFIVTLPRIG
jgi:two-component system CheB/CheR fusion protein